MTTANGITTTTQQSQQQNIDKTPNIKKAIKTLSLHQTLDGTVLGETINEIMSGNAEQHYIAAFLSLLNPDKFTPDIISTAAKAMRSHSIQWPSAVSHDVIDIVGTGGDGLDTFNVSTSAAFIIAACGVKVVKHGNRSSSSKCGSADLLEATGANIDIDIQTASNIVQQCNFCFLFAQRMHPSMKYVGPIRKQLGIKTIFNVLGPLTNPCTPTYQLTGVYNTSLGRLFAESLKQLGVKSAMVVHSSEGMDEISIAAKSHIWHLHNDGSITEYDVDPVHDFGVSRHELIEVASGTPKENAHALRRILSGEQCAEADHVIVNAAAALVVAGKANSFKNAVKLAREVCSNGKALNVLDTYIKLTQQANTSTQQTQQQPTKKTILQTISENRINLVDTAEQSLSFNELCYQVIRQPIPQRIDILARLHSARQHTPGKTALLAEIKRASPSAGDINANIDPVKQALSYADGGAAAISVLCEPKWFKGSLNDLRAIRQALDSVPNRPAILLKDFVEDEYQLVEGRAAGADTVLLIVASLSRDKLIHFISVSRQLGMEPLVEVANENEMSIALSVGALLIGVNNRNLHTFTVDTQTTNRLASAFHNRYSALSTLAIERRPLLVALSGIKTRDDVIAYEQAGAGAVLVGETLMKSNDAKHEISVLLGTNNQRNTDKRNINIIAPPQKPYVKICGMKNVKDAIQATAAGADLLGLIFVQKSKRCVTLKQAQAIANAIGASNNNNSNNTNGVHNNNNNNNNNNDKSTYFNKQADNLVSLINTAKQQQNRPLLVGVFMNETEETINEIANNVPLDIVQLHGNETYEFASRIHKPVIKAISVDNSSAVDTVLQSIKSQHITAILLDTKCETGGGSGQTFDWSIASHIQQQHNIPILLAGGLHHNNISLAVQQVKPFAVDVASGVEYIDTSTELHKNHYKVEQFIANAKIAASYQQQQQQLL